MIALELADLTYMIGRTVGIALIRNPDIFSSSFRCLAEISLRYGSSHNNLIVTKCIFQLFPRLAVGSLYLKHTKIRRINIPDKAISLHFNTMKSSEPVEIHIMEMITGSITYSFHTRVLLQTVYDCEEIIHSIRRVHGGCIIIRTRFRYNTQPDFIHMRNVKSQRLFVFLVFHIQIICRIEQTTEDNQQFQQNQHIGFPLVPHLSNH